MAGLPLSGQKVPRKDFYDNEELGLAHRRVKSNTGAAARHQLVHHRTFSDSHFHSLTPVRMPLSATRGTEQHRMTPDSTPPASPRRRKRTRGFLGTLDAAILYFETVQHTTLAPQNCSFEVAALRQELEQMTNRARILEKDVASLAAENAHHVRQREHYEHHIGNLNARVIDLQIAYGDCKRDLEASRSRKAVTKTLESSFEFADLATDEVATCKRSYVPHVQPPLFPTPKAKWPGSRPSKSRLQSP